MKESGISRCLDMIRLVKILALSTNQDRRSFGSFRTEKKKDRVEYIHKKSCFAYYSQEVFYNCGKEHPSTSVVGDRGKDKKTGGFYYRHQQHGACLSNRFDFTESYATK